jgi:DNA invertase Pin-like site-specific DNA recombinase
MSTAVYLRVSSRQQEVKSQKLRIDTWLDGRKIVVSSNHWYIDKESGATLQRAGLDRLKQAIFDGHINHVVMYGLDRFARTMIDGLVAIDEWQKQKVKLTFVSDQMELDFGTWQGEIVAKIMVAIKLAFAEAERTKLLTRQRAGIDAAKALTKEAKRLHANGMRLTRIATHLGKPASVVQKMLDSKTGLYWGGAACRAGCTKIDRNKLRRLIEKGVSNRELMKIFSCSENTIVRQRRIIGLAGDQRKK